MPIPLLLFIIIPFIEIMLILRVSDAIGGLYTVFLVLGTAIIGINLLKRQGFSTLARFQQRLQRGEIPAQEILEGMMIAFAGALLLTPGFLTDTIGFSLLFPPIRRSLAKRTLKSGKFMFMGGMQGGGAGFQQGPNRGAHGDTFDGEFRNESEPKPSLEDRDRDSP